MKKLCNALALILCAVMLLSTITVIGDSGGKTILTLQEAKELALQNNTQYRIQDGYIGQTKENYNNLADRYSGNAKGANVAEKAKNRIENQVALENAYNEAERAVFDKKDIKRKSDYDVTIAYYDVMKAKYSLDDAKRSMDLAAKDYEVAKIKLEFGMITKTELSQLENSYKTAQAKYNTAFSEMENSMATLSKEIGKDLDVNKDDIDMKISMPNIAAIDLNKIREDNLSNNSNFFDLKNSLDLAKYKKAMTEEEYDDYNEKPYQNDNIVDDFRNAVYDASRDYDNAIYKYDNMIKELDISLKTQHAGITTLYESISNLRKSLDNKKATFAQDKIRYENGQISKNAYEKSESELKDLENQLLTNIVNLNSQYLTLTQYSYTDEK